LPIFSLFSSVFSISFHYSSDFSCRLNSEKIWKIWKKSRLNSEKIWKIWKKSRMNSEMIWKIQKKIVKR
jgi:hypothetical protein